MHCRFTPNPFLDDLVGLYPIYSRHSGTVLRRFPLLHQVDSDEEYDFHAERTGTTERGNDANENEILHGCFS